MTMHPYDLYQKLVDNYGKENMLRIAIEEMAELTKELMKYDRVDVSDYNTKAITEEIADVLIAMDELMWLFGNHEIVDSEIEGKICRTMERVKEYEQAQEQLSGIKEKAL